MSASSSRPLHSGAIHTDTPTYLACELQRHQPLRALCSDTTTTLHRPHASSPLTQTLTCSLCTGYGNNIPVIRDSDTLTTFKTAFKTHLCLHVTPLTVIHRRLWFTLPWRMVPTKQTDVDWLIDCVCVCVCVCVRAGVVVNRPGRVSSDARCVPAWSVHQHTRLIPVSVWRWLPGGPGTPREPVCGRGWVWHTRLCCVWVSVPQHTRHVCLHVSTRLLAGQRWTHLSGRGWVWHGHTRSSRVCSQVPQHSRQLRVCL